MKNRRMVMAALVVGGALAWPAGTLATGASEPAPARSSAASAVVDANAQVRGELDELAVAPEGGTVHVVSGGEQVRALLQDGRFLSNVHVLQDYLNNNDAGVLRGADVAITDLVAIDVRGGDVTVYTR